MALSRKKPGSTNGGKKAEGAAFRPLLLAGGLGLLWFAIGPSGAFEDEASPMMVGALMAARLAVDFVGACLLVALLRSAFVGGRYALAWSRARAESRMR